MTIVENISTTIYSQRPDTIPPVIKYHLLKNPHVGGSPMIENPPMKKPIIVRGILVNNPAANHQNVWSYIYEE